MVKRMLLKFTGFSFVGMISTLISLVLIFLFIGILKTALYPSYIAIYIITIYLSYYFNATFVFKVDKSISQFINFFLVYLSGMILGMISIKVLKAFISYEDWVITFLILPVTTIWNFTFVAIVLGGKNFFIKGDNSSDTKKIINNSLIIL